MYLLGVTLIFFCRVLQARPGDVLAAETGSATNKKLVLQLRVDSSQRPTPMNVGFESNFRAVSSRNRNTGVVKNFV